MKVALLIACLQVLVPHAPSQLTTLQDQICPFAGYTQSFVCTTGCGGLTIWNGTAFTCRQKEITLLHDGVINKGDCNGSSHSIVGQCLDNTCSESRLDVKQSHELNNTTINCIFELCEDNCTSTHKGLVVLQVLNETEFIPPPLTISVSIIHYSKVLVFSWEKVNYVTYNITPVDDNCGECVLHLMDASVVLATCTQFVTSPHTNLCNFSVQSVICGNISGEHSTIEVNLKVADSPNVTIIPRYWDRSNVTYASSLKGFLTTFQLDKFNISHGLDGTPTSFSVNYTSNGCLLNSSEILALTCNRNGCQHLLDVTSFAAGCSYMYTSDIPVDVTVQATNILGSGPNSTAGTIANGTNTFVDVRYDSQTNTIICSLSSRARAEALKQCNVRITFGEMCEKELNVHKLEPNGTQTTLQTRCLDRVQGNQCFSATVTAMNNVSNKTVIVEGKFCNSGLMNGTPAVLLTIAIQVVLLTTT